MRVLLTGASGFIGSHAVDALLRRGHEVHAVARTARGTSAAAGVVWHETDMLLPGAPEAIVREAKASHLLHLAWYAVPGRFWAAPENERWIDATLRMLRCFGEAGGRRAVVAGTCAEYAWGSEMLSEDDTPIEPATLYGACKHATHVAATAVTAQLGVSLAWGRVFFLYGPGEHPDRLVASVARGLLEGEEVPTTDGVQRRDFMHVRDVASAFVALVESEVEGAVNVATGEPIAVRDIVMTIANQTGGASRLRLGALNRGAAEPEVIAGRTQRLSEEVRFRPQVPMEQGIAETVRWWRAALSGAARRNV